jgi:hypothetical protein
MRQRYIVIVDLSSHPSGYLGDDRDDSRLEGEIGARNGARQLAVAAGRVG